MFGKIVRRADGVALRVRQLSFDRVMIPALFVQEGRRHAPEAVAGHLLLRVTHAPERGQNGVLAHGPLAGSRAGKDVTQRIRFGGDSTVRQRFQLAQYLDGLA
jgi:hypothetical protein